MSRAVLEGVVAGVVRTVHHIDRFIRCTLLSAQESYSTVYSLTKKALSFLQGSEFVRWDSTSQSFIPTPFGGASVYSTLCPTDALIVFRDLSQSRKKLVLESSLHLIYLITPVSQLIEPDWSLFFQKYMRLPAPDRCVADVLDISERNLVKWTQSNQKRSAASQLTKILLSHRRFYSAMILKNLIDEVEKAVAEKTETHGFVLEKVSRRFGVGRGQLQSLLTSASAFAGMFVFSFVFYYFFYYYYDLLLFYFFILFFYFLFFNFFLIFLFYFLIF
jgi:DNA polymerase theta